MTTATSSFFSFFFFFFLSSCFQPSTVTATEVPTLPSSPTELAPSSTISAAPSYLPDTPKFPAEPPALTPDITPLFPSPKRGAGSGPAGGMPTIQSNPSPPNPDVIGPDSAETPFGPSAAAAATAGSASSLRSLVGFVSVGRALALGLMIMWWL